MACFFAWKHCCSRITGDCHDETAPGSKIAVPKPRTSTGVEEELLPTIMPTQFPQLPFWGSDAPTLSPSANPTKRTSLLPFWGSNAPSATPTFRPPTLKPTSFPHYPTNAPSNKPTTKLLDWQAEFQGIGVIQDTAGNVLVIPTPYPTSYPTGYPTLPTDAPTPAPSFPPTPFPTSFEDAPITDSPTPLPSITPTYTPTTTVSPTQQPTTHEQELLAIASSGGLPTRSPTFGALPDESAPKSLVYPGVIHRFFVAKSKTYAGVRADFEQNSPAAKAVPKMTTGDSHKKQKKRLIDHSIKGMHLIIKAEASEYLGSLVNSGLKYPSAGSASVQLLREQDNEIWTIVWGLGVHKADGDDDDGTTGGDDDDDAASGSGDDDGTTNLQVRVTKHSHGQR
jgi:hypothetical protein